MSPEFPARLWQVSLSGISISQTQRFPAYAGPTYCHCVLLQTRGQQRASAALHEFLNASWFQCADLDFLPTLLTLEEHGGSVHLREEGAAIRWGERLHIYLMGSEPGDVPDADVEYAAVREIVRLNLAYLCLKRFWIDGPLERGQPVRGLPYYQAERGFRVRCI
ncbi:hypothetical protein EHF33_11715 [Deinococcus psychrotolerans]|uniref:Uncharacterized protein n=1 Tax=Deinococcus psychrotolerans TaxID=2489213 RepID=A0A3G8YEQ3_9DEIO|nr:hypothetical protein [Deinococcus psychrotolerans]AZI43330.1 hypothetical protein EHF33_11715 [Deinococcus psychrotolerans]